MTSTHSFLEELVEQGGIELSDCIYLIEDLYINRKYIFVPFAARLFFECFINLVCKHKNVPIQEKESKDGYKSINYSKTLKYIFNESDVKDKKFYTENYIEDLFKEINKKSHYFSLSTDFDDITIIKENSENILKLIFKMSKFYYSIVGKRKIQFPDFELPTKKVSIENSLQNSDIIKFKEKLKKQELELQKAKSRNKIHIEEKEELKQENQNLKITNNRLNEKIEDIINFSKKRGTLAQHSKILLQIKEQEIADLKSLLEQKNENERNLRNKIKILENDNFTLNNKYNNLKQASKKEASKNKVEDFLNTIVKVIIYMNTIGCYTHINHIFAFLRGYVIFQTQCFPKLRENELWGKYANQDSITVDLINRALTMLLKDKRIIEYSNGYKTIK